MDSLKLSFPLRTTIDGLVKAEGLESHRLLCGCGTVNIFLEILSKLPKRNKVTKLWNFDYFRQKSCSCVTFPSWTDSPINLEKFESNQNASKRIPQPQRPPSRKSWRFIRTYVAWEIQKTCKSWLEFERLQYLESLWARKFESEFLKFWTCGLVEVVVST